jgi:ribosomal protein L40E
MNRKLFLRITGINSTFAAVKQIKHLHAMIYCSKCGAENGEDGRYCLRCGHPLQGAAGSVTAPPPNEKPSIPETYLWQSIVVTILCCLPLGIPAIVYATQVEKYFMMGEMAAAQRASRLAKNFCIWALVGGLLFVTAYVIFYLVMLGGAVGSTFLLD